MAFSPEFSWSSSCVWICQHRCWADSGSHSFDSSWRTQCQPPAGRTPEDPRSRPVRKKILLSLLHHCCILTSWGPTWQNPTVVSYPPAQMTSLGSSKRPYSRHSFLQYSFLTTGTSTICSMSTRFPFFVNPHPATRHFALFFNLSALLGIWMGWILWPCWDFCSCSCRYRTRQYENGYVYTFNQTW